MKRCYAWLGRSLYLVFSPLIHRALARTVRARVFIISNDELLVVKNWLGQGLWSLPGGGIKRHESVVDAAVRELHEELGLNVSKNKLNMLTKEPLLVNEGTERAPNYGLMVLLPQKPVLQPRHLEIVDHQWIGIDCLEEYSLAPQLKQMLPILAQRQIC